MAAAWITSGQRVLQRGLALLAFVLLAVAPGVVIFAGPIAFDTGVALAWEIFTHNLKFAIGLALILELYEQRERFRKPSLATIGTIIAASAFAVLSSSTTSAGISTSLGMSGSTDTLRIHEVWLNLFETAVALVFVMQRDVSRSAEAQLQQHALQWRLARSRADAVVARASLLRLEPEVLFNTLRDTRSTYLVDADRADASMEALTTYLRAVLQQSKSGQASLGDEFDLAAARMRLGDFTQAVELTLSADPKARALPVPAGVLPQLLCGWARALDAGDSRGSVIRATAGVDGSRLVLRFDAPSLPPRSVLDPVLLQLRAAEERTADDMVRFDGKESFTLYLESQDDA